MPVTISSQATGGRFDIFEHLAGGHVTNADQSSLPVILEGAWGGPWAALTPTHAHPLHTQANFT